MYWHDPNVLSVQRPDTLSHRITSDNLRGSGGFEFGSSRRPKSEICGCPRPYCRMQLRQFDRIKDGNSQPPLDSGSHVC